MCASSIISKQMGQTKSLLLSSYEFKRPLHKGAWWRDFFLLPEEPEGLLREAKAPRDDGTAAKLGTDKPPSPAAAKLRVGTTFPELLPLLVTAALLPPPPLVFPVPPVLLLVPGTELAPPAFSCGRLLDMMRGGPTRNSPKSSALFAQSIRTALLLFGRFSRLAG